MRENPRIKAILYNCRNLKTWFERFVRGVDLGVGSESNLDQ